MKPVKFKQQNINFTAPQGMTEKECGTLPACIHDTGIVSCWKMNLWERLKVLFTGCVWFDVMARSQPPIWLGVDTPFEKKQGGVEKMGEDEKEGTFYINGEKFEGIKELVISTDQSESGDMTAVTIAKLSEAFKTVSTVSCQCAVSLQTITTAFQAVLFCYPNQRIVWLALHHRRERVRKKNMRRITRWLQRGCVV